MPDEQRLNRIEDALTGEIKESATFRGELRQFMSNSDSFIKAVNSKADRISSAIVEHKEDPNAHGAGVKRELDGKIVAWVTAISGFAGIIGAVIHKALNNTKP